MQWIAFFLIVPPVAHYYVIVVRSLWSWWKHDDPHAWRRDDPPEE